MAEISPKDLRFCTEYVKDWNGRQAAIRTGYAANSAEVTASKLLRKPNVAKWIADYKQGMEDKFPDEGEKICAELKKIGYSNIQDYIGKDFTVNDFSKLPREVAAAIASVETETITIGDKKITKVKFKLYDKVKSLELLGRHHGIFEKDNAQKPVLTIIEATEFKITRRKK